MNRMPQATDDRVIETEIKKLQAEVAALNIQRQTTDDQLQRELRQPSSTFDTDTASRLKRDLANIAERTSMLADRIAALELTRPTPDQRAEAEERARIAVEQADTSAQAFTAALAQYLTALDAVEGIAIAMINARAVGHQAVIEARELVARYGLAITIPAEPGASTRDQKLARLLTRFISDAATSTPDISLQYELSAARAESVLV